MKIRLGSVKREYLLYIVVDKLPSTSAIVIFNMGKNKKKGSRVEKAAIKKEKKIAQRIKKDIAKIGEVS